MLTIDSELEKSLQAIAHQEHRSINETIQILLSNYLNQHPEKKRFVQRRHLMRRSNSFAAGEIASAPPVQRQSITQLLTGLLANSNVDKLDYRQHLLDKYL